MPGERNPQSVAKKIAPPPQGESVLDASMMAELIVTKKEIGPQLKKSAGTSRVRPKCPGAGSQQLPLEGRHLAEHWILWFLASGALWVTGFAASGWTPVEGKIGADAAARTQVIQGHSQDRRHGKRQRSGHAGLDMACRSSVICMDDRRSDIDGGGEFLQRSPNPNRKAAKANLKSPRRRLSARACPANTR